MEPAPHKEGRTKDWRNATMSEKWRRMGELSALIFSCRRAVIRLEHPGFTPRQVHRELLFTVAGEKCFNEMIAQGRRIGSHLPSVAEFDEDLLDEPFIVSAAVQRD